MREKEQELNEVPLYRASHALIRYLIQQSKVFGARNKLHHAESLVKGVPCFPPNTVVYWLLSTCLW